MLSILDAQDSPVTQTCLGCICEAISGCNRTTTCAGDVCGLFRITWAYWADAGKPTITSESPSSETGTDDIKLEIYINSKFYYAYVLAFLFILVSNVNAMRQKHGKEKRNSKSATIQCRIVAASRLNVLECNFANFSLQNIHLYSILL